ncbi:MAG: sulfatase, partial [Planctomycetota bacterium]
MRMTHCFQAAPMCSPTRHCIYTGLYPVRSGAYPNHTFALPKVKSIAHDLKPLGYRVALSGKRHISPQSVFPFEYSSKANNPDMDAIDRFLSDAKSNDEPYCLIACSNEPHTPWNRGNASQYPPAEVRLPPYVVDTPKVREDWSKYLAEITYFDHQVGQILEMIDKHDDRDNTLVMVVSEQGNSMPFAKWTCYDNGLQSAMITRWPGHIPANSQSDAIVEYVDILPTLVQAAGGQPVHPIDGRSFLDVLRGKSTQHKQYTYGLMTTRGINQGSDAYPIRSIRSDRYRLIWNLNYKQSFQNTLMFSPVYLSIKQRAKSDTTASYWVERYRKRPEFELFDVVEDPMNLHDLSEDPNLQTVKANLLEHLKSWMKQQGDQGMKTELDALNRQTRGRKSANKNSRSANAVRRGSNSLFGLRLSLLLAAVFVG